MRTTDAGDVTNSHARGVEHETTDQEVADRGVQAAGVRATGNSSNGVDAVRGCEFRLRKRLVPLVRGLRRVDDAFVILWIRKDAERAYETTVKQGFPGLESEPVHVISIANDCPERCWVLLHIRLHPGFLLHSHGRLPRLEFGRAAVKRRGLLLLLRRALKHRIANPIVECLEGLSGTLNITDFLILTELALAREPGDINLQTDNRFDHCVDELSRRVSHFPGLGLRCLVRAG